MSLSVDLSERRITAAVGELTGEGAGRIIGLGGSGLSRLWLGQELHRRKQYELESTEPGFRAEVPISSEIEIDGWQVSLVGRADGVLFDDRTAVRVDEIKTLHFAVDLHGLYADERLEPFRNQIRLYAWMLSSGGPPIPARLILMDIVTGEEKIEKVAWAPESVEAWLRKQVYRLVSAETRRMERLERVRAVADQIPFPHPEYRARQEDIGQAVTANLQSGGQLLLQAPTGTGKTAAVLHPAVKAALANGKRVFFPDGQDSPATAGC